MKLFLVISLLLLANLSKANDTLKEADWALYAHGSFYSVYEVHLGFEKYIKPLRSISFDLAYRHTDQVMPCYFFSYYKRSGVHLLTSYNMHKGKSKAVNYTSGYGVLLGFFHIDRYRDGTPCNRNYIKDERVPSIGLLYTGRWGFKKLSFLELFFKTGLRYNMILSRYHSYRATSTNGDYVHEVSKFTLDHGASPVIDLGIRLQIVKRKKSII